MSQLVVRYHRVTVKIEDQVAVTHVDQVFYNPNDWAVEGEYIFPLPQDAAVSSFTLWVDGKPVEGEVFDAEQARRKYQEIVSSLRDPALLEYAGRGALQAHIFPIPPEGERRIELEYSQVLSAEKGLLRYVYPLNTEKFSAWPLENVSVSVTIASQQPIRAIYSPSHTVAISREGEHQATAGYEAQDVRPDTDFALYFSVGDSQAFHLVSWMDSDDPDGFFLLLLAPKPDQIQAPLPKDVLLVLDRSGSMEGDKFQQAQEALRYVLRKLNPGDRFNIIAFSTGLESFAHEMQPAIDSQRALEWVDRLSAQGSTDINRALLEAAGMAHPERPTYLIFLTDGLPTEGEVESQKILANLSTVARSNLRLFTFGVGYDVDTILLDSLAQEHHGTSTYVLPGERLDEILSTFYERISSPVLTDLKLDFGNLSVYDLYPSPLPDLFRGSQIVLVGRYRQGGKADVSLSGIVNGRVETFRFEDQTFASSPDGKALGETSTLPRLWATRKIGYLLNQLRLNGANQEVIDQVVRLSIRYGIITPYTSYLVTEEAPLGSAEQERIVQEQFSQMQSAPAAPASGAGAVQKAADQGAMAAAEAPSSYAGLQEASGQVRILGSRAFVMKGNVWIDTLFDPDKMKAVKVSFLSDDYFALANADPQLAAAFSLGPSVIAVSGGLAYEIVPQGNDVDPIVVPVTDESNMPEPATPTEAASLPVIKNQPGLEKAQDEVKNAFPCAGLIFPFAVLAGLAFSKKRH